MELRDAAASVQSFLPTLARRLRAAARRELDVYQFGVYTGGSMASIARRIRGFGHLWGFDSFAGLPVPSASDTHAELVGEGRVARVTRVPRAAPQRGRDSQHRGRGSDAGALGKGVWLSLCMSMWPKTNNYREEIF